MAVGLSLALLERAQRTADPGPTAATLDEAFSAWLGAGLGLAFGSLLCAAWVRDGSRLLSGWLAGVAAYVVALAPLDMVTRPDDIAVSEEIGYLTFMLPIAATFALVGAAIGSRFPQRGRYASKETRTPSDSQA